MIPSSLMIFIPPDFVLARGSVPATVAWAEAAK